MTVNRDKRGRCDIGEERFVNADRLGELPQKSSPNRVQLQPYL